MLRLPVVLQILEVVVEEVLQTLGLLFVMLLVLAAARYVGKDLDEARDRDALVLLLAGTRLVAILLQVKDDADVAELLVYTIHALRGVVKTFIKAELRFISVEINRSDRYRTESLVINHDRERHA